MSRRTNTHRPGYYLMVDDISGFTFWSDEIGRDWDGTLRDKRDMDGKHPDINKKVLPIETYPKITTPQEPPADPGTTIPAFIGGTSIPTPPSPADHLFNEED